MTGFDVPLDPPSNMPMSEFESSQAFVFRKENENEDGQ